MTSSEERISKTKYRIIGSFSEYLHQGSIPVSWLLDGIFVDPRNSKPMEMDALSIYNICKLESTVKTQVFKHPLLNRIRQVGGFRFHNAWGLCETHCRFSAAGLKLLAETIDTDDNSEISLFENGINSHLEYTDKLSKGIWFLHDSQEADNDYHDYYLPNEHIGSKPNNILVLNTHIDTLCLLISLLDKPFFLSLTESTKKRINFFVNEGIKSLKEITDLSINPLIEQVDQLILHIAFKHLNNNHLIERLINIYFYRIRIHIKKKYPIFFHKNGYIEREIGLAGTGFYYHIITLNDICKLTINLLGKSQYSMLIENLKQKIEKGINFAIRNRSFLNYMKKYHREKLVELLETIQMSMCLSAANFDERLFFYCKLRKNLTPSAGLKGSDLTYNRLIDYHPELTKRLIEQPIDGFCTRPDEVYLINYSNEQKVITYHATEIKLTPNSYSVLDF